MKNNGGVKKKGDLKVTVVSAQSLQRVATGGAQHPYAVLRLGKAESKCYPHKNGGASPSWNQTFLLPSGGEADLLVEIYHKSKLMDALIGKATVSLADAYSKGEYEGTYAVLASGRQQGILKLRMTYTSLERADLPAPSRAPTVPAPRQGSAGESGSGGQQEAIRSEESAGQVSESTESHSPSVPLVSHVAPPHDPTSVPPIATAYSISYQGSSSSSSCYPTFHVPAHPDAPMETAPAPAPAPPSQESAQLGGGQGYATSFATSSGHAGNTSQRKVDLLDLFDVNGGGYGGYVAQQPHSIRQDSSLSAPGSARARQPQPDLMTTMGSGASGLLYFQSNDLAEVSRSLSSSSAMSGPGAHASPLAMPHQQQQAPHQQAHYASTSAAGGFYPSSSGPSYQFAHAPSYSAGSFSPSAHSHGRSNFEAHTPPPPPQNHHHHSFAHLHPHPSSPPDRPAAAHARAEAGFQDQSNYGSSASAATSMPHHNPYPSYPLDFTPTAPPLPPSRDAQAHGEQAHRFGAGAGAGFGSGFGAVAAAGASASANANGAGSSTYAGGYGPPLQHLSLYPGATNSGGGHSVSQMQHGAPLSQSQHLSLYPGVAYGGGDHGLHQMQYGAPPSQPQAQHLPLYPGATNSAGLRDFGPSPLAYRGAVYERSSYLT